MIKTRFEQLLGNSAIGWIALIFVKFVKAMHGVIRIKFMFFPVEDVGHMLE